MSRKSTNKSAIRKHCRGLTKHAANKAAKSLQGKTRDNLFKKAMKRIEYLINQDIPSYTLQGKLSEILDEFPQVKYRREVKRQVLDHMYGMGKPFVHAPKHHNVHDGKPVELVNLPTLQQYPRPKAD